MNTVLVLVYFLLAVFFYIVVVSYVNKTYKHNKNRREDLINMAIFFSLIWPLLLAAGLIIGAALVISSPVWLITKLTIKFLDR